MQALNINNKLIAYTHRASLTKTIFFVNSLGSDQRLWDEVINHLPSGYGYVTYDLPGHGLSDHSSDVSIENFADDAIALLDALNLQHVIFCGVSIGGMIGQVLLAKRPDLFQCGILCNTDSIIGSAARWEERRRAIEKSGIKDVSKTIIDNWFAKQYYQNKDRILLHQNMVASTNQQGYLDACHAISQADLTSYAKQIDVPVLCIAGDEDKSVPVEQVKALAQRIPNAQLEVIEQLGHLPCLETPALLANLIIDFEQKHADENRYDIGMRTRKSVLGEAHVAIAEENKTDFDQAFQILITEGAWGSVWSSPGISARERSMLTLALLAATGNFEEIPMHIRASKRTGATLRDITEAFQHVAIYAGVPKANHAIKLAKKTFIDMENTSE